MKIRLKMNKFILFGAVLLSMFICICFVPFNVCANNDNFSELDLLDVDNSISVQNDITSIFTFTPISETECDVRLADKTATQAIIPEKVEINGIEYDVTVIAANGFTSATKLEMVRLPKTVKTIGSNAFINCKALNSITLTAVETIGANAFAMTNMDYLIIPTTVTSVASTILRGANTQVYVRTALEEGTTVPEGWVTNWNGSNKNQAVEFDSSFVPEVKYEFVSPEIATFALGDDVELRTGGYYVTGYQEFCTIDTDDYKEVYIPATYTGEDGIEYPIIGIDSFAFLYNVIDKVTIGYAEEPIKLASESFFGLEGSVITFNREIVLESEDYEGNLAVSESVFADSKVLTIILPNSIEAIGNNMFDGCENLRDIHFINPDETLSSLAEANMNISLISTQRVKLPTTVTYIGNNAFNLTRNILELYVPNSVEVVGSNIISGWTSNQTVYVDLVADDPKLENWNEFWALGSGQDDTANVVYRLSDASYQITYNVDKEYHNNPETYISSEGVSLLPVQMAGYTFKGWYLDEEFTKPIENITIGMVGNITLYAKLVGNEYTIKYNRNQPILASNPVAGDMEESTHTYGTTSAISENKFSLKGWTFTGWVDDDGNKYQDGDEVTTALTSGKLILYAQWAQNSYNLKYVGNRPNDASSSINPNKDINETHTYEEEFNIKGSIFSVTGWTFTGWNTEKNGSGDSYVIGSKKRSLTEGEEITLYAQWKMNTYIIEYNSNGGSGTIPFIEPRYEDSYTLPKNPYTYAGKNFTGWNTEADGSGISYKENQIVSKLTMENKKRITLYAQWKWNDYNIWYNSNFPNGKNNSIKKMSYKVNTPANLEKTSFSYTGWTFKEWNTEANGSGDSYKAEERIDWICEDGATINLYAQWEATTYTITYNANLPMTNVTRTDQYPSTTNHTYDSASNINPYYTLVSWEMTGWYLENGTTYTSGQQVMNLVTDGGNITFVAQWKEKENVHDCKNSNGIYEIVSIDQLKGISQGSYKIMRDIKIEYNWEAIKVFTGTLDLDGHTITYRYDSLGANSNYGFILNNKGTITNGFLKSYIVQSSVDTSQENEVYIGGVVAENNGIISNVGVLSSLGKNNDSMTSDKTTTDINVRSVKSIIGGIAGINNNTIENCTNNASIGGSYYIGGIAGKNYNKINECTNEGQIWYCSISGDNKCVGGIVAANYENAEIKKCNSNAEIIFAYRVDNNSTDLVYMARIVGWTYNLSSISGCTGLTDPIDIKVSNLTNLQLMYIKSENKLLFGYNFNVGKLSSSPDTEHEHEYIYTPDSREPTKWHIQNCICGSTLSRQAHVIRYADRNNTTANCIYCHYALNLKTDLYIVEGGLILSSTKETDFNCILQENVIVLEKDESDENSKNEIQ